MRSVICAKSSTSPVQGLRKEQLASPSGPSLRLCPGQLWAEGTRVGTGIYRYYAGPDRTHNSIKFHVAFVCKIDYVEDDNVIT